MHAVVIHEHGGPEVLRPQEWPDPRPRNGEVVVQLRAAALNYHDVLVRAHGLGTSLPRILGIDGAGVRRDTGEPVIIQPSLGWGLHQAAPGPEWTILGDVRQGTYAELVSVPAANVYPKPSRLSWAEAAALPTAGLTAYRALFTRARLRSGETIVVLGAGSGISTFVVLLASSVGARTFVTSSSSDKIDRSMALGAAGGVSYLDEGWVDHLTDRMGGGADVVIDPVGRDLATSLRCLRPGGRLVTFGAPVGATASIDVRPFYFSQCSILGTTLGSPEDFGGLLDSLESGGWTPVVDSVRPLDQAGAAHRRMEDAHQFGKLVLSVT